MTMPNIKARWKSTPQPKACYITTLARMKQGLPFKEAVKKRPSSVGKWPVPCGELVHASVPPAVRDWLYNNTELACKLAGVSL